PNIMPARAPSGPNAINPKTPPIHFPIPIFFFILFVIYQWRNIRKNSGDMQVMYNECIRIVPDKKTKDLERT
ncbi:hypothetical protein, partial [Alistipes putredinis]|uniref:hypothetical protein n=1 Tax=Alistipes putredinis TaxID=28117 RepID=UPI003AAE139C